jgi:hypothetical protein
VQQFGERTVGRALPQGPADLERHEWDSASRQDVLGGITPAV